MLHTLDIISENKSVKTLKCAYEEVPQLQDNPMSALYENICTEKTTGKIAASCCNFKKLKIFEHYEFDKPLSWKKNDFRCIQTTCNQPSTT